MNPKLLHMMQTIRLEIVLWEAAHGRIMDFNIKLNINPVPVPNVPKNFVHPFLFKGLPIPAGIEHINNIIVSFAAYSIYESQPISLGPYTEAFNMITSLRVPFRIQIPVEDPETQLFNTSLTSNNISINVVLFWPHKYYSYGTRFRPEPHLVKPSRQRDQLQTMTKWEARIMANPTRQNTLPKAEECRKDITLRLHDPMSYIKHQAAQAIDNDLVHARLRLFVAGVDITTFKTAAEANLHDGSIIRVFY